MQPVGAALHPRLTRICAKGSRPRSEIKARTGTSCPRPVARMKPTGRANARPMTGSLTCGQQRNSQDPDIAEFILGPCEPRTWGSSGLRLLWLLVEKVGEKFDDVFASGSGRLGIISDCSPTFDAGVVGGGGLPGIVVDDHARLPFLESAFARCQRLRELHRAGDHLIVESMISAGIFDEADISASLFQPCDVVAAWANRHPVVGKAVIKPDRPRANLFVIDQRDIAGRVEADIGGEACAIRGIGALEAVHAGVN